MHARTHTQTCTRTRTHTEPHVYVDIWQPLPICAVQSQDVMLDGSRVAVIEPVVPTPGLSLNAGNSDTFWPAIGTVLKRVMKPGIFW